MPSPSMSLPNCATRAEFGVFLSMLESMNSTIRWTALPCSSWDSLSGSMPGGKPLFWFFKEPTAAAIGSTLATAAGNPDLIASPSVDSLIRCGWITSTAQKSGERYCGRLAARDELVPLSTPDSTSSTARPTRHDRRMNMLHLKI